jgi:ABC-type lipoprotein release transport system permease subunit
MLPSSLQVERETEAYAALWRSVPKALLTIAFVLICLLAVGTTLATMMVAHAALEARRREIATLRVLGFDNRAAAVSILVEALPFALLGAWIAAGIVWWLRDGALQVGAWSVIEVNVDLYLMLVATGCATGIAMLGTLPLALKTLRRRALEGLQDLRELDAVTVAQVRAAFGRRQVAVTQLGAAPAHLAFAGNTSGR